jgi:hypothetical protein
MEIPIDHLGSATLAVIWSHPALNTGYCNCSEIDEIVTSYVESILEELVGEDRPEDLLDMEAFQEMMIAYLPQSELIKVCLIVYLQVRGVFKFKRDYV